jgi:DNA topoisomerase-1
VKGKAIEVTELGLKLENALEIYSPIILDEELTKNMGDELEEIEKSSKDLEKMKEKILEEAKVIVRKIAEDMSKHLEKIGKMLVDASDKVIADEIEENTMTECPVCHKGELQVRYGRAYKRYFVACNAYPDCKTTYSLPPQGVMKPARIAKDDEEKGLKKGDIEKCPECGFPMVTAFKKGKAPWRFCFNPECSSNEELQKKKEEFKQKLASGEIEIIDGKVIDHTKPEKKKTVKKAKKKKATKKVKKTSKKVAKSKKQE